MSARLLPSELSVLPAPWNLTSDRARRAAVPAADVKGTLQALDRVLAVLPRLPEPAYDDLPDELVEYFDFTAEFLADVMPTLDDLDPAAVARVVAERTGAPASAETVYAVAEFWLRYVTVGIIKDCLRRLPEPGDEISAIVERELLRQPAELASLLLSKVAKRDGSLVSRVAADDRADPALRQYAESLLARRES